MEKKTFLINHPAALLILITGVALSVFSFIKASNFERIKIGDDFSALASDRTILFEKAINDDLNVLHIPEPCFSRKL